MLCVKLSQIYRQIFENVPAKQLIAVQKCSCLENEESLGYLHFKTFKFKIAFLSDDLMKKNHVHFLNLEHRVFFFTEKK